MDGAATMPSGATFTPASGAVIDLSAATVTLPASALSGLKFKASVRAATTANITIATALNNGDTLDGITLATGDRVLVKNQSAPAQNGIYLVAASPSRATDFDAWTEIPGSMVAVEVGTAGADTVWIATADQGGTIDTTAITFSNIVVGSPVSGANGGTGVANTGVLITLAGNLTTTGGAVSFSTGSGASLVLPSTGTLATIAGSEAFSNKSVNGVSITSTSGAVLTLVAGKTFAVNHSLTLAGTDSTTMTFPSTTATIARTDAAQTFTGTQTFSSAPVITSIAPGANFTLSQNGVTVFTSKQTGGVVNTLVLDQGTVGIGLASPSTSYKLDVLHTGSGVAHFGGSGSYAGFYLDATAGGIPFVSLAVSGTQAAYMSWTPGTSTLTLGIGNSTEIFNITSGGAKLMQGSLIVPTQTPASAGAAGVAGTVTWDSSYIYICTATNTWKRVAIATW